MTTLHLIRATAAKSTPADMAHDLLILLCALGLAAMIPLLAWEWGL